MKFKKLKLQNFRQFTKKEVDLDSDIILIHGDNALGKSTILEGLFFITNQRSPYTSDIKELIQTKQKDTPFFRLEAVIEDVDGDCKEYALFQNGNSRQYFIDKHKTSKKKFEEGLSSTIFSPEQIELLMISPQRRRDFLDLLIEKIDRDYSEIHSKMKKVLKQRNAYLKKLSKSFYQTGTVDPDDNQIKYWSELFSHLSSGVMVKRTEYIDKMQTDEFAIEYKPSVEVGQFAQMLPQKDLEKIHFDQLLDNLKRDVAMGHTTVGAHRDDWDIIAGKDIRIHGSRGEKRLAVGRILIKSQEMYHEEHGYYPILLLDDISSELDDENTDSILNDEFLGKQQVIITTIKLADIPDRVKDKSKLEEL